METTCIESEAHNAELRITAEAYAEARSKAKKLIEAMSSEEKIRMLGGVRGFFIPSCERLGIQEVFLSDASCGINIRDNWLGEDVHTDLEKSVAFPCFIALASTWNRSLCSRYARAVGEEARAAGIHILLGPGMNIYRQSQCGRNFEYLGEDPYLASALIRSYVIALQKTGVGATLKHFIANNSDYFRRRSNSIVDERALHEIYMPAFKAGIEAGALSVMTAYNLLNGEWCSQSKHLISTVLRGELGFDKLVMTDWWAIYDCEKTVLSGQDLEMPKADVLTKIPELLASGNISIEDIEKMLTNIIAASLYMDFYNPAFKNKDYIENYPEHEEIALQTARESIVLLKNNAILPLAQHANILLSGKYACERIRGGGAAEVEGYDWISLKDALEVEFPGSIQYIEEPSDAEIQAADIVLLSTGTFDHEAWDRAFALPADEEAKIQRFVSLNKKTVVIVQSGSGIRMTDWNEDAAAILYCWYGGQLGNTAIAEVLSGRVNPSGKLAISIEKEFADSPASDYLPEGAELYEGWNDEVESRHPVFDIEYSEGVLVGYRWYDSKGIAPLYPFGHGLSYTVFEYSNLNISPATIRMDDLDSGIELTMELRNVGSRDGTEVVQIYVRDHEASVERPEKELKHFCKISLAKGESRQLAVTLSKQDFQFWSPETKTWLVEAGTFSILAARSSRDIALTSDITILP